MMSYRVKGITYVVVRFRTDSIGRAMRTPALLISAPPPRYDVNEQLNYKVVSH